MRKKSDFILRFCLIVGDALALILSFAMAYFIRVHVDPRPYAFESQLLEFTWTIVFLVPIMLIILAALGLYKKSIFLGRSRFPERIRLVLAAILSVAALIVYDFFVGENLFPVRVMAVTASEPGIKKGRRGLQKASEGAATDEHADGGRAGDGSDIVTE